MFDVWKKVLDEVEQAIPREQFATWFPDIELVEIKDGVVVVGAPNIFKMNQLQKRYAGVLEDALKHNEVEVTKLQFTVISSSKPKVRPRENLISSAPPPVAPATPKIKKPQSASGFTSNGLSPRYQIDNFVIGSNNDLAVSVAKNIIDNPGATTYNPFFLYGGPGLGKTHLVQAIGNTLLRNDPSLKIFYTPMSGFYADFIKSIGNNKGSEFHQKFKTLDVLIIDDFQMITGKDASQTEFFDIFNDLYQLNKQIIVTSDRLPSQIKTVDERLASRLSMRGAFDLQLPQFEDKCAILRSKADFRGVEIESEAIEYLAENVKTNIRDLEGEFEKLLAIADLKNMTPLQVISDGYVSANRNPGHKTVSARQVVEKVAKYYQLSVNEMCSKSRVSHIKTARQVAMYILSKELGMSTTKIAYEVGVKDHTTVMHGIKKITNDLKLDFSLRDQIAAIRDQIYG